MKLTYKLVLLASVFGSLKAPLTNEQKQLIIAHCTGMTEKLGIKGIVFDLDALTGDNFGCYDPINRTIALSDSIKRQILDDIDNGTISLATFTVLHEVGHHNEWASGAGLKNLAIFIGGGFALNASLIYYLHKLYGEPSNVSQKFLIAACIATSVATSCVAGWLCKFLDERHADRFATRSLCRLHGGTHAQEFLGLLSKEGPKQKTFWGYQSSG